ncbi:Protein of unknown function [Gryllus bimaculatus]|nr:Protein of unknown function [Gryllus bimaculatus]
MRFKWPSALSHPSQTAVTISAVGWIYCYENSLLSHPACALHIFSLSDMKLRINRTQRDSKYIPLEPNEDLAHLVQHSMDVSERDVAVRSRNCDVATPPAPVTQQQQAALSAAPSPTQAAAHGLLVGQVRPGRVPLGSAPSMGRVLRRPAVAYQLRRSNCFRPTMTIITIPYFH